jgi:hypothetical protein
MEPVVAPVKVEKQVMNWHEVLEYIATPEINLLVQEEIVIHIDIAYAVLGTTHEYSGPANLYATAGIYLLSPQGVANTQSKNNFALYPVVSNMFSKYGFYVEFKDVKWITITKLSDVEQRQLLGFVGSYKPLKINNDGMLWYYNPKSLQYISGLDTSFLAQVTISTPFASITTMPLIAELSIGDCGALYIQGLDLVAYRHPYFKLLNNIILLKFLHQLESRLLGKGFILATCKGENASPKMKGLSLAKLVGILGELSGCRLMSVNGNHESTLIAPKGSKEIWQGAKRGHYVHLITMDGIRKFYETDTFKELELLDVYNSQPHL